MLAGPAQRQMKMAANRRMVPTSARRRGRITLVFSNPRTSMARTLMRHNKLLRPDKGKHA